MNNLFAFLGWYGRIQTLQNKDNTLSNLMKHFFPVQKDYYADIHPLLEKLWNISRMSSSLCPLQKLFNEEDLEAKTQIGEFTPDYFVIWLKCQIKKCIKEQNENISNIADADIKCRKKSCSSCATSILKNYFSLNNTVDLTFNAKMMKADMNPQELHPLQTAVDITNELCQKDYIQPLISNLSTKIIITEPNEIPKDPGTYEKISFQWPKEEIRQKLCSDISALMKLSYLYTQTIQTDSKSDILPSVELSLFEFANSNLSVQRSGRKVITDKNLFVKAENTRKKIRKKLQAIQAKRFDTNYMEQFLTRAADTSNVKTPDELMPQYESQKLFQLATLLETECLPKDYLPKENINFTINLTTDKNSALQQVKDYTSIYWNDNYPQNTSNKTAIQTNAEVFKNIKTAISSYVKIQLLLQWSAIQKKSYAKSGAMDRFLSEISNSGFRFSFIPDDYSSFTHTFDSKLHSKLKDQPQLVRKVLSDFVNENQINQKALMYYKNAQNTKLPSDYYDSNEINMFFMFVGCLNETERLLFMKSILSEINDDDLNFNFLKRMTGSTLNALKYFNNPRTRMLFPSSLLDAGIFLGLLSSEDAAKNPFLINLSTERIQKFNAFKFLQSFSTAPITDLQAKHKIQNLYEISDTFDDGSIQEEILPRLLIAFNQFAIERFTNINYLLSLYNKIYSHLEFQPFIHKFDIIFKLLMLIPLPETRALIISTIENFLRQCLIERDFNKIEMYISSMKKDCDILYKELQFILIPIAILTIHYVMSLFFRPNASTSNENFQLNYFKIKDKSEIPQLNYFKVEEDDEEILPILTTTVLKKRKEQSEFSQFTLPFYQYFYEQTKYLNNPKLLVDPILQQQKEHIFSTSDLKSKLNQIPLDVIDEVFDMKNIDKNSKKTFHIRPLFYPFFVTEDDP
jgi:hypothetical protein